VIDLHAHTTVSDGGDSPAGLVTKAAAAGLAAIAVTDHDNDAGCAEAVAAGRQLDVEVIPGVEISCDIADIEDRGFHPSARPTMHLLGYFIPLSDNPLSAALAELQEARLWRNHVIVKRLNELGIPVTFEEVENEAGGPGAQIGRPHFAEVLVRHGAVADYQSAFDDYLAKGAKAYITRKLYRPGEATELMIEAGVVPVLAHPFTLQLGLDELGRFVDELVEAGLKGIEGYHGDLTELEQEPYRDIGKRKGLIVSGGSDYHGDMRPDRALPGGKCGVNVPQEALDELKSACAALAGAPG